MLSVFFVLCSLAWADVVFETRVPGNLFYPTDPPTGTVKVVPSVPNAVVRVAGTIYDTHKRRMGSIAPVTLSAENGHTASIALIGQLGYHRIVFTDDAGRTSEGRYAVIPANPHLGDKEVDSPFGVNTHFNQGWPAEIAVLVKRVGIGWIRDGDASLGDPAIPAATANHLCHLPAFALHKDPSWIKKNDQGRWDFSEAIEFHRKYAEKYGAQIDYYDLMNEPANAWGPKFGGSWDGGPWLEVFVDYGRQITQAIKQVDPTAKILWEDLDVLLYYRKFYELGAAPAIDLISPHAYNLHRTRPLPEEQPVLEQMPEFRQFVKQHNLPWKLWHGEVGFSSFTMPKKDPPMFYSPVSELGQAQMLVRMMVLHLARGVEKIFWYDFKDDGINPTECEHHFGLIQHDLTPKPAVVAYANLIHQLRGGKWLGGYLVGGHADAYAFVAERTGKPVVIAWVRRGQRRESIAVPSAVATVTITDLFGVSSTRKVENHRVAVDLSESPIYITGLQLDDLKDHLTAP